MKTETKLAIVIAILSLTLPIASYWSFRTGYKTCKEICGQHVIVVPKGIKT
jgi:hypothetical protein